MPATAVIVDERMPIDGIGEQDGIGQWGAIIGAVAGAALQAVQARAAARASARQAALADQQAKADAMAAHAQFSSSSSPSVLPWVLLGVGVLALGGVAYVVLKK